MKDRRPLRLVSSRSGIPKEVRLRREERRKEIKQVLIIATTTATLVAGICFGVDYGCYVLERDNAPKTTAPNTCPPDKGQGTVSSDHNALSPEDIVNQKLQEIFREILEQQEMSPGNPSSPSPAGSPPAKPIIVPREEGDLGLS